jgi:hypothetical protein
MTHPLRVSGTISLPLDFVTKTCGILAQRRKGKTYTASVIAEELVAAKVPWAALDPTGAWWGLRASADAKSAGLPVIIFGGQHADVPLERTGGKVVADLVIESPGFYVIDLSLFESKEAERQFATDFAERLYRLKKQAGKDFAMHLFVDEADMFIPQQSPSGDKRMLGAFEALVRRGGLSGLGTTLISQRAAVVNKNALEQLDMLIVLRNVGPNDRKAIDNYVMAKGTEAERQEMMGSLASLKLGEAWIWEPGAEPPLFNRVMIRERHTFNSSATPKVGERRIEPRQLAEVDIHAVTERMAATIEKAKAEDPKELRRINADLQSRIVALETEASRRLAARPERTIIEKPTIKIVEKAIIKDPQIKRLETLAHALGKRLDAVVEPLATMREFKISLDGLIGQIRSVNGNSESVSVSPTPARETVRERQTAGYRPATTVRQVTAQLDAQVNSSNPSEEYDMADFEEFYRRTVQRLQQDGFAVTVKVEPKEVVLKEFQVTQVSRILEATAGLSSWQKSVIRFMEARGTRATKKDVFTAILGKEPSGGGFQQERYKAIDEMTDAGWLRKDSGFVCGDLAAHIKGQLAHYNATDQEVDDVVGQVLLRLK